MPWLARLFHGHFPFRRTLLDVPIAIFLCTAIVGALASYDRPAALAKLWLVIGAIALYYALAGQPRSNLGLVTTFLSGSGAAIAVYFLLTNDWRSTPADLELINRLGMAWMSIRPELRLQAPNPNAAGGLIALFTPFTLALLAAAWKERRGGYGAYALVAGVLSIAGVFMTSSRGAWLALGLALGIWLLWEASGWLVEGYAPRQMIVFSLILVLFAFLGVVIILRFPGGPAGLVNRLPGNQSAGSRLDIYPNTLYLIRDFPYTGGGLRSFAGLYSQYIEVIPFFLVSYSHNLFLDLAVEQGLPGLAAFLMVVIGSIWLLLKGKGPAVLRWAILASLVVMIVHGLVDDPLYGNRGTPFVFFLPALIATIYRRTVPLESSPPRRATDTTLRIGVAGIAVLLAMTLVIANRKPLLASWYADLGAVDMARVELADFPSTKWADGSQVAGLTVAEALFKKAIGINPGNATANYRLGLIAMLRRDFPAARGYLEKAYAVEPGQRGVQKVLGYCYVWLGDYERAGSRLAGIREAKQELETYTWWWATQGRPDLAQRAESMLGELP